MLQIEVQTKNIIEDKNPSEGIRLLKKAGFSAVDFSLNSYLSNTELYRGNKNYFFDQSVSELERFFSLHKKSLEQEKILVHQMHMPYPNYIPNGSIELNHYLWKKVAPKSLQICKYFECKYMVLHGFKLAKSLGSEEQEWQQFAQFLEFLAPMAKEMGIVLCLENIYDVRGTQIVEGPCCNARKMVDRIDRMNEKYKSEVLGFCFDTGHAKLVKLDMELFLKELDYRLKVLHIHDNDGVRDLHQVPFTFTKTRENKASTDWDGFIRGLKSINFNNVLSFETAPVLTSFPKEMQYDTLEFIGKIGKYFIHSINSSN